MPQKSPATESFWRAFLERCGRRADDYAVTSFGDNPQMADELLALVLFGTKRATASLRRDYAAQPSPAVGDFVIVVDSKGTPRCIWRTTDVAVKPLIETDADFAWDEGEGDRSLEYWLDAHREFFARQAAMEGFEMHDRIETVLERFEVVWPLSAADRDLSLRRPLSPD